MSHSIFISYCREDERQALHLLALLRNEGFEVWIDQEAIAGASIWSDEIVQNIKSAKIFIALLSTASVASANVAKEIALAMEHGKIILPIEIGHVTLPGRLEYALAGIQRTGFQDEQAIIHAVRSQVAKLDGETLTLGPIKLSRLKSTRARLALAAAVAVLLVASFYLISRRTGTDLGDTAVAVLPFASLNTDNDSTRNLDIFSDELISRLSSITTLKTASASASSGYRDSKLTPLAIASELHTRYVVDGSIRKQNDVNYIAARVTDAKLGGVVFEQFYSGNNHVIFAIRKQICQEIEGFLRGTSNAERGLKEAEDNLKAHPKDPDAYARLAHEVNGHDKARSLTLYQQAIALDPNRLEYYLGAGLVAERLGAGVEARDFGSRALPIAYKRWQSARDSMNLIINYAIALDISGNGVRAAAIYDSLIRIHPKDNRLVYNAACCYARQTKADRAIELLTTVIELAPGRISEIKYDPDFDNIRSDPRYLNLIYGFRE